MVSAEADNRPPEETERPIDEKLQEWSKFGIAIHHAGLELSDRHLVEAWFKAGRLKMLISTSVSRQNLIIED